jgi:group I intron endonuclease
MGKPIIGVYKISNTLCPEGKYYIGYSCNIRRRWNNHKCDLKNGKHINIYLQNVYNKYGADCFKYEILHDCETKEEAQEYETSYLQDLTIRDKLYNLLYDSIGGDTITHHPNREQIIEKVKKTQKLKRQLDPKFCIRKDAPIVIDGVNYSGITEAGKILNIPSRTINGRIYSSSSKFINYHFLDEKKQTEAEEKERIRIENKKEHNKKFSIGRGVPIIIDNIYYESMREAGKAYGVDKDVISDRVKSEKIQYKNYRYADSNKKINSIRPVLIDDILYKSATYASQETGICRGTIINRIKSPNPKFSGYKYVDTKTDEVMLPLPSLSEGDVCNEITKYTDYIKTNCVKPIIVDTTNCGIKVMIDNIYYESLSDAGRNIGVSHKTIKSRILSPNPKFSGYKYADTKTDEVMPSLPLLIVDDIDNREV